MNGSGGYRPCPKRDPSFNAVSRQFNDDVFMVNRELNVNGEKKDYYPSGALLCKATYTDGLQDGPMTLYYETGELHTKGDVAGDSSSWSYYDKTGREIGYCTASAEKSTWPDGSLHFLLERNPATGNRHGRYTVNNEDGSTLHHEMYSEGSLLSPE